MQIDQHPSTSALWISRIFPFLPAWEIQVRTISPTLAICEYPYETWKIYDYLERLIVCPEYYAINLSKPIRQTTVPRVEKIGKPWNNQMDDHARKHEVISSWHRPVVPFCLDEGPDVHNGGHVMLLYQLDEFDQVKPAFKIVLRDRWGTLTSTRQSLVLYSAAKIEARVLLILFAALGCQPDSVCGWTSIRCVYLPWLRLVCVMRTSRSCWAHPRQLHQLNYSEYRGPLVMI
jgi:hypothetical protein